MGDRGEIHFEDMNLWYYTHWGGSDIVDGLRNAIKKAKPRWDDSPYCLRIIISQLIGEDWNSETGHGLSNNSMESEHPIPVVNIQANTVNLVGQVITFQQFIDNEVN